MNLKKFEKTAYPNIYRNKENNTYAIDISLGIDILTGKRLRTTMTGIKTEKEAKKILNDEKIKISKKQSMINDYTFLELYDKYIDEIQYEIKKSSFKNKKMLFGKHILPIFKDAKINDITEDHIQLFHKKLIEEDLGSYSKNKLHKQLNAFFNWCIKKKYIIDNPMKNIANFKIKRVEMKFWDINEYNQFISYIENIKNPNQNIIMIKTIVKIIFFGGFRISELMGLTLGDIDFKNLCVDINKINYSYN
jgi:integrase